MPKRAAAFRCSTATRALTATAIITLVAAGCATGDKAPFDSASFVDCDQGLPYYCELGEEYTGSEDAPFRGIHIGTNNGQNYETGVDMALGASMPQDYLDFLARSNANWVAVSVALRYDGTAASETVSIDRVDPDVPSASVEGTKTWDATALQNIVSTLRANGYNVLVSIALEPPDEEDSSHRHRFWMGAPWSSLPANVQTGIPGGEGVYFWDAVSTDATQMAKVNAFWDSYIAATEQLLEDVCPDPNPGTPEWDGSSAEAALCPNMVQLGTETDFLFRKYTVWDSRLLELKASADEKLPSGVFLTYGTRTDLLDQPGLTDSREIWKHLGLDYIGLSAYIVLSSKDGPESVCKYRNAGPFNMFRDIDVLRRENNNLPAVFTEFGYPDLLSGPVSPNDLVDPSSRDGNNYLPDYVTWVGEDPQISDGEETQGNAVMGVLQFRESCDDIVSGMFLWDNNLASDVDWSNSKLESCSHGVREWVMPPDDLSDFQNDHGGEYVPSNGYFQYAETVVSTYFADAVWDGAPSYYDTANP